MPYAMPGSQPGQSWDSYLDMLYPKPKDPTYQSLIDPATGLLNQQYLMDNKGAYSKNALQEQGLEEANALGEAGRTASGQGQNAWAMLAGNGGIDRGAAERLARGAAETGTMAQQGVRRAGEQARSGIGLNQQAIDTSGKQMDVQNALKSNDLQNQYNLGMYNENMKAWGANRTAAAQENARKK